MDEDTPSGACARQASSRPHCYLSISGDGLLSIDPCVALLGFVFLFFSCLLVVCFICLFCLRWCFVAFVCVSFSHSLFCFDFTRCLFCFAFSLCLFCFLFMPRVRSRRGRPARGAHSRAAAQSASARSTVSLPTGRSHQTRRGTRSGDTAPSVAPAADASSTTDTGCSREELLALIREEFRALQQ